jgi:hypothetical protein
LRSPNISRATRVSKFTPSLVRQHVKLQNLEKKKKFTDKTTNNVRIIGGTSVGSKKELSHVVQLW